jgi:hypothetical protein
VTMSAATVEQQHVDLQFGPNVLWMDVGEISTSARQLGLWRVPPGAIEAPTDSPLRGVRAMYARLAQEYERELPVSDHRGGVEGDLFPF